MYFSSKKGKWYNRFIQMNPLYRYILTFVVIILLIGGWRFALYAYMEQLIANDRAAISHLNAQLIQLSHAQKVCADLSCRINQLNEQIGCYNNKCCLPNFCQMQIDLVIDEAHKAGLQMTSYAKDQENTRDYCTCSDVQFNFVGTMDSLVQFFSALRQSKAMIECNSFSCDCQQDDATRYNVSCKLAFVSIA